MNRSTKNRGFRRGVVASGMLMGILALASSGAFAQAGGTAPDEVYALTKAGNLLEFDGNEPNDTESVRIRGLRDGDSLVGIDFRPSSQVPEQQNALYGVGKNGFIYTINPDNGRATLETALFAATAAQDGTVTIDQPRERVRLEGRNFGVDFNPTVDRLRIISEDDQNLRVNVDNGATLVDGDLAFSDDNEDRDPWATGAGYTNSQPDAFNSPGETPANTTMLYDLEIGLDSLVEQNPANDGDLQEVGSLGSNFKLNTGFDIVTTAPGATPSTNEGYAALQRKNNKAAGFFSVNLQTGDATSMGRINGGNTQVIGLAIPVGGTTDDGDDGEETTMMTP